MSWLLSLALFLIILILRRDQNKLKRRIDDNKMLINDLYRIDDERLLKNKK